MDIYTSTRETWRMQYKYLIYYYSAKRFSTYIFQLPLSIHITYIQGMQTIHSLVVLTVRCFIPSLEHTFSSEHLTSSTIEIARHVKQIIRFKKLPKSCASIYSTGKMSDSVCSVSISNTVKSLHPNIY